MQVPAWFSKQGWHMAGVTLGLALEDHLATGSRLWVKAPLWWFRGWNSELIEVESSKFRGDQVGVIPHIAETGFGGYWKLRWVVQAWIVEYPLTMHLQVGDEGVPVGHRSPSGVGVKVHAGKAKGWREQGG